MGGGSPTFDDRIRSIELTMPIIKSYLERDVEHKQKLNEKLDEINLSFFNFKNDFLVALAKLPCETHLKTNELKFQGIKTHLIGMWSVVGSLFIYILVNALSSVTQITNVVK